MKYHYDFLEDEGEDVKRQAGYEDDDQPEREAGSSARVEAHDSRSGSSGSWQDAADEARP